MEHFDKAESLARRVEMSVGGSLAAAATTLAANGEAYARTDLPRTVA